MSKDMVRTNFNTHHEISHVCRLDVMAHVPITLPTVLLLQLGATINMFAAAMWSEGVFIV